MLDDQNGDVFGQLPKGVENARRLGLGHACGRLIEQQHFRFEAESNCDLDQALLAVGQIEHALWRIIGDAKQREQLDGFIAHGAQCAGRFPPAAGRTAPLGHTEGDVVEHAHVAEQGIDLKSAADAALDALRHVQLRDILPGQHDAAGRRRETPGQQIDEGGFASAVRADQGVTRAGLQREVDVGCNGERAEALAQLGGLQHGAHGLAPVCAAAVGEAGPAFRPRQRASSPSQMPSTPPRANNTTITSIAPIPKYQYSGNCLAR